MARIVEPGWTNLSIGEPRFLQQALWPLLPEAARVSKMADLAYPDFSGVEEMRSMGVVPVAARNHQYLIITNGAKQALAAAMYGLNQVKTVICATAQAPYWPSFPTLAKQAGLRWNPMLDVKLSSVEIVTYPNNPTGMGERDSESFRQGGGGNYRIWDAVYASRVYGFEDSMYDPRHQFFDAAVGSASKAFGLSGIRLGWASFAEKRVAEKAAEFVELTTSGASTVSQAYFLALSEKLQYNPVLFDTAFRNAKETLRRNAQAFNTFLGDHCDAVQGAPMSHGGMFAWFKPTYLQKFRDVATAKKVRFLDGRAMGADEGWVRASLGLGEDDTARAFRDLGREML